MGSKTEKESGGGEEEDVRNVRRKKNLIACWFAMFLAKFEWFIPLTDQIHIIDLFTYHISH